MFEDDYELLSPSESEFDGSSLNNKLLDLILNEMDPKDACALAQTCRRMKRTVDNHTSWPVHLKAIEGLKIEVDFSNPFLSCIFNFPVATVTPISATFSNTIR